MFSGSLGGEADIPSTHITQHTSTHRAHTQCTPPNIPHQSSAVTKSIYSAQVTVSSWTLVHNHHFRYSNFPSRERTLGRGKTTRKNRDEENQSCRYDVRIPLHAELQTCAHDTHAGKRIAHIISVSWREKKKRSLCRGCVRAGVCECVFRHKEYLP